MKVGLIDVDGHHNFPNLALMKLSAWHKQQGGLTINSFSGLLKDLKIISRGVIGNENGWIYALVV